MTLLPLTPAAAAALANAVGIRPAVQRQVIAAFAAAPPAIWWQVAARACEQMGDYVQPPADGWGPHEWEMSLLAVTGTGDTRDAAIHDWIKATTRTLQGDAA